MGIESDDVVAFPIATQGLRDKGCNDRDGRDDAVTHTPQARKEATATVQQIMMDMCMETVAIVATVAGRYIW